MLKLMMLSIALAVAFASPSGLWGGLATPWNAAIAAPLAVPLVAPISSAPLAAVGPIGAYNYRGSLSLAPGQPANILAADGRPLDTLSVYLDRAAHITAKAVKGSGHWLKRRSIGAHLLAAPLRAVSWAAPAVAVSHSSRIDVPAAVIAPIGIAAAPIAPLALGHGARLGLW